MNKLYVFFGIQRIGELEFEPKEDRLTLRYLPEWKAQGFPISPHLPLSSDHSSFTVRRFLENLFPEGRNLEVLLDEYRIGKTHVFRIIQIIGQETTGALTFTTELKLTSENVFRPVSETELIERLNQRSPDGLIFWDGKPRLSVAGVQDKLPLTMLPGGRMGLGEGEIASTHILKFQKEDGKAPFLVINEFFCMRLAKVIGLPVAEVIVKKLGTHPVLFVERFDRLSVEEMKVEKLHVIDGCQALDLPSSHKYERNFGSSRDVAHIRDGANLKSLFAFTKSCRVPAVAALGTLNWVIFNLCIGNSDSHAKNISYFVDKKGIDLAPFYDLVSITVYPQFEQELAMSIGDEFKLNQIFAFQLAEMCDQLPIKRRILFNQFKKFGTAILENLEHTDLVPLKLTPEEASFLKELKEEVRVRTNRFLDLVGEILKLP